MVSSLHPVHFWLISDSKFLLMSLAWPKTLAFFYRMQLMREEETDDSKKKEEHEEVRVENEYGDKEG